jgi:hypothetical protein
MTMDNSKGSLILKALSPAADEAQIIAYLEKRAKSIPADQIPSLLRNLPVVLSRNVAEETGRLVVRRLEDLGAEALFLPSRDNADPVGAASNEDSVDAAELMRTQMAEQPRKTVLPQALLKTNKEVLIIVAMLAIAWMINSTLASQYLLLGCYTLPAVVSAYLFGRRQAVLTAFASILLVSLVSVYNPGRFDQSTLAGIGGGNQWYHIISWGCILLVTAYTMGTLYERLKTKMEELRQTYQGLLLILRHFIAQDEDKENHCFRVSIYATRIASAMGMGKDDIEDIRSAALVHDLGRLKISRSILHKAAQLSRDDRLPVSDGPSGDEHLLSGPMGRILPLLLGHHEPFEQASSADPAPIPLGARILAVADAYDTLTAGSGGQPPLSPEAAKARILDQQASPFDPDVVTAFAKAFDRMEMELPTIIL